MSPLNDKYSNCTLGELIDAVPEDCTWLLRNDELHGYFCHIHEKKCRPVVGFGMKNGISCIQYAVSPEEAMRQSLREYEQKIRGLVEERRP
jgi:hypothetical protein